MASESEEQEIKIMLADKATNEPCAKTETATASLEPLTPLTHEQFDFIYNALMNERSDRCARLNEALREGGEEPVFKPETTAVVIQADATTFERLINFAHELDEERVNLARKLGQLLIAQSDEALQSEVAAKPGDDAHFLGFVYFSDGFCSCRKCGHEWRSQMARRCPVCLLREALDDLDNAERQIEEARKIAAMIYRELLKAKHMSRRAFNRWVGGQIAKLK